MKRFYEAGLIMSQHKRNIFAYIDETGNTGGNIFDETQPDFFTAALVVRGDFDLVYGDRVRAIARKAGQTTLHAKELKEEAVEAIADDLHHLIRSAGSRFFISRVEKKYLLVAKMFDSIFDSGENAAVGWHHYNFRFLRILLVFKLAELIDEEDARLFWSCLREPDIGKVNPMLVQVCAALEKRLERLPDARSREVLGEGLRWAMAHPESIQIHIDRKSARQGHFPNLVAFVNMLDGLEDFSQRAGRPVAKITHDEQSEFEATLRMYHQMFSNASGETLEWAGEKRTFRKVAGSAFDLASDSDSPGVQIADVVMWLYSRFRKGRPIAHDSMRLLEYVFEHAWENDFSFAGVERAYVDEYGDPTEVTISPEQEKAGREMVRRMEVFRQMSMAQYEQDKTPPFMRSSEYRADDKAIEEDKDAAMLGKKS